MASVSQLRRMMQMATPHQETVTDDAVASFVTDFPAPAMVKAEFSPVQSGTGDPSPDNVRPISGWTEAEVTRTGINLWDGVWEPGDISDSTGQNSGTSTSYFRSKNYIPAPKNSVFFWYTSLRSGNFRQYYYDKDYNYLGLTGRAWNSVIPNTTLDFADKIAYLRFRVHDSWADADATISINYPATDITYHPYTGQTIHLNWESSAGTVYGGYIQLNEDGSGVLVAEWAEADMGTLNWTLRNSSVTRQAWWVTVSDMKYVSNSSPTAPPLKSDRFRTVIPDSTWLPYMITQWNQDSADHLVCCVEPGAYASAAAFKAAMSGVQLVYELATPITYPLSADQLRTLLGENCVFSNLNSSVTVRFFKHG